MSSNRSLGLLGRTFYVAAVADPQASLDSIMGHACNVAVMQVANTDTAILDELFNATRNEAGTEQMIFLGKRTFAVVNRWVVCDFAVDKTKEWKLFCGIDEFTPQYYVVRFKTNGEGTAVAVGYVEADIKTRLLPTRILKDIAVSVADHGDAYGHWGLWRHCEAYDVLVQESTNCNGNAFVSTV